MAICKVYTIDTRFGRVRFSKSIGIREGSNTTWYSGMIQIKKENLISWFDRNAYRAYMARIVKTIMGDDKRRIELMLV